MPTQVLNVVNRLPRVDAPERACRAERETWAEVGQCLFDFQEKYGRAPRVLCLGNVANNGYNNGKLLSRAGWDIDVMCYDYYHIMGCPEWEDADFEGDVGDPFHPNWRQVNLRGFRRPSWFIQGPRSLCVRALLARRQHRPLAWQFWRYVIANWQRPHVQHATIAYYRAKRLAQQLQTHWARMLLAVRQTTHGMLARAWTVPRRSGTPLTLPVLRRALTGLQRGRSYLSRRWNQVQARVSSVYAPVRAFVRKAWLGIGRRLNSAARRCRSQPSSAWLVPLALVGWLPLLAMLAVYRGTDVLVRHVPALTRRIAQCGTQIARGLARLVRGAVRRGVSLVRHAVHAVLSVPGHLARAVATLWTRLIARRRSHSSAEDLSWFDERCAQLVDEFARAFPERDDQLVLNDILGYRSIATEWRKLCGHYDLIIGYASDGIYPLLLDKRPYVAYEHGTIRSIPFDDSPSGRVCAMTYRFADASLITNCDNILAAERLALDNHRFIPHPINEDWLSDRKWEALRQELRTKLASDFIIFHPSRQHWEAARHPSWEKGNDIFIRGFARFVHEVNPAAGAVFVDWGKTVEESKALLDELGVGDRVLWIKEQPTASMTRYLRACDVTADQFYLGAFGGVMPKAMVYGRPTLIYLDEARHRWCFDEMPPICNTRTDSEVFAALRRLYVEPTYLQQMVADGQRWYERYHSSEVVSARFCAALRRCLPF